MGLPVVSINTDSGIQCGCTCRAVAGSDIIHYTGSGIVDCGLGGLWGPWTGVNGVYDATWNGLFYENTNIGTQTYDGSDYPIQLRISCYEPDQTKFLGSVFALIPAVGTVTYAGALIDINDFGTPQANTVLCGFGSPGGGGFVTFDT